MKTTTQIQDHAWAAAVPPTIPINAITMELSKPPILHIYFPITV